LYQLIFKHFDDTIAIMPRLLSPGPKKTYREQMAELGDTAWVWSNDHTCSGSEEVITSGGVYNIPSSKEVYISSLGIMVLTVSKSCTFEVVKCTAVDGGGTATPISPKWQLALGPAQIEIIPRRITLQTPIKVANDTHKSVSYRVNGVDNATHIMIELKGWYE